MIKGYTFQYQLFDSQNWAHIINTFFNKNNGITKGCGISRTDTSITIYDGRFVTFGRISGVVGSEVVTIEPTVAGELFARLVYEIDLSKANTTTEFNQGAFKVLSSAVGYPDLIQEDLDAEGLVYQMLFAEFKIDQIGIKNFVDKRTFLNFNAAQAQFQAEFDTFMDTLEAQGYETPTGAQAKATAAETNAKAYVDAIVAALVDSSPTALNTLNELAAALGDDPNFATTVLNEIATKADSSALTSHISDYVRQPGYGVTAGAANTYTLTPNPAIAAYTAGMGFTVKIHAANTGASTLNVNAKGAKVILDSKGNAMTAEKLRLNGVYTLRYDGTNFILQGEGGSGDATAPDLLSGKKASTDAGDIVGTMVDRTVGTYTADECVPGAGYIDLGIPDAAFYGDAARIRYSDAEFIAANIANDVSPFGLQGTLLRQPRGIKDMWFTKALCESSLAQHAGGLIGDIIYTYGGALTANDLYKYNIVSDSWTAGGSFTPSLTECYGTVANGLLYIFGGIITGSTYASASYAYNPVTNTMATKASMPALRAMHMVVHYNGIIYCIAGRDSSTRYDTNYAYNMAANTWSTKTAIPEVKQDGAGAEVDGLIYCMGGFSASARSLKNYAYNVATNTWSVKADMLGNARDSMSATRVGSKIYSLGGYSAIRHTYTHEYDPLTNTWSAKTLMPVGLERHLAVADGGGIYVVGGSDGGTTQEVYLYAV